MPTQTRRGRGQACQASAYENRDERSHANADEGGTSEQEIHQDQSIGRGESIGLMPPSFPPDYVAGSVLPFFLASSYMR